MAVKLRLPRKRFFRLKGREVEVATGLLLAAILDSQVAQASEAPASEPSPGTAAEATAEVLERVSLAPEAVRSLSVEELKALLTPEVLTSLGLDAEFIDKLDFDLRGALRDLEAAFRKKIVDAAPSSGKIKGDDSHADDQDKKQDDADTGDHAGGGDLSPLYIIGGIALVGGGLALALSGDDDEPAEVGNRAPAAVNDAFTVAEDTPVTINVLGNDTDADSNSLTITAVNGTAITATSPVAVTGGVVTLVGGNLVFTPAANYNGSPSFTYTISDGAGGVATGTVNGTVTPVNDAPVAVNDAFVVAEDTAVTINVRGNDTDIDNNPLTVTAVNGTAITATNSVAVTGGVVTLVAGNLVFTPAANYNGSPTFTYTVSDGAGGVATATVSGTVTPVNDAPVNTLPGTVIAPQATAALVSGLSIADADGPAGTYTTTLAVSNGTLAIATVAGGATVTGSGTGSVTITGTLAQVNASLGLTSFTSAAGFTGAATLTMTTSDGTATDVDVLNLTVAAVQTGIVQDGYINGAVVFYDANGNGARDDGEPFTTTNAQGQYVLALPPGATGSIVALGGVNVDTGLLNTMPLKAPIGSTVVNPLTTLVATLVESGQTVAQANAAVAQSLGLPAGVNPTTYDFLAPGQDPAAALVVQKAAAQINQLIADAVENGVNPTSLIAAISAQTSAGVTLDLTSPAALATLLEAGGANPALAQQLATETAAVNQAIEAAPNSGAISDVQEEYNQPDADLPPSLEKDTAETVLGQSVVIDVTANDVDPEGNPLSIVGVNGQAIAVGGVVAVTGGSVTLDADGNLVFTPGAGFVGQPSFEYTASDGRNTNSSTVTVRVIAGGAIVAASAADVHGFAANAGALAEAGVTTITITGDGAATVTAGDLAALDVAGIHFAPASTITVAATDAQVAAIAADLDLAQLNIDTIDVADGAVTLTEVEASALIAAGVDFDTNDDVTLQAEGTHSSVTLKGMQDLHVDSVSVRAGVTSLVVEAGAPLSAIAAGDLPQFDIAQTDAALDVTLNIAPGALESGFDLAALATALDAAGVDHLGVSGGGGVSLTLGQAEALASAGIDFTDAADVTLAVSAADVAAIAANASVLGAVHVDHLDVIGDVLSLSEGEASALIGAGVDFADADNVTLQAEGTHSSVTLKGMQDLNIDSVSVRAGVNSLVVDAGAPLSEIASDDLPQFDIAQTDAALDVTLLVAGGALDPAFDADALASALDSAGIDHIGSANGLSLSFDQASDFAAHGLDFTGSSDVTVNFADAELAGIVANAGVLAVTHVDQLHAIDGSTTLSDLDASTLVGAGVSFAEGDDVTVEATGTHMSTSLKGLHGLHVDTIAVADGVTELKLDAGDLTGISASDLPQFDVDQTDAALDVTLFVDASNLTEVARLAEALREAGIDHFSVGEPLDSYDPDTAALMQQIAADSGIDFVYDPDHGSNVMSFSAFAGEDYVSDQSLMRELISSFEGDHDVGHGGTFELTDGTLSSLVESGTLRAFTADHLIVDGTGSGDQLLTTLKEIADFGVDQVRVDDVAGTTYVNLGALEDPTSVNELKTLIESLTGNTGEPQSIFTGNEKIALVVEADVATALSQIDHVFEKLAAVGFTEIDVLGSDGVTSTGISTDAIEVKLIGVDEDLYRHLHDEHR